MNFDLAYHIKVNERRFEIPNEFFLRIQLMFDLPVICTLANADFNILNVDFRTQLFKTNDVVS